MRLTPTGQLILEAGGAATGPDPWLRRVATAFTSGSAPGLFALAATTPDSPPSAPIAYWRDFASHYLTELCRTPESAERQLDPIVPPDDTELSTLLLSAPPMPGGEYLSREVLSGLWIALDRWTREQVAQFAQGLSEWLGKHAPMWHQVGRVCFHLAENKRDDRYPFAFMATYAPRLSRRGHVQYQPHRLALQEYAGQRNKRALFHLLAPVQRASERIDFVRQLVDSGEIFHPRAWTQAEAYRLLTSVPLLEECGLLVRLPDWWRKRPRPRVVVTIGDRKQSRLGVDAMLDFNVGVALGDERLSKGELQKILASEDSLTFMKGQWVEVDRERLAQALEHWKSLEARAAGDGLAFIEGMRLLAGAPADLGAEAAPPEDRDWAQIRSGEWLSEILSSLRDPARMNADPGSRSFRGTLRPYQETGHRWLRFLSSLKLGACLADDMGLGKTVQVISLLAAAKESGGAADKPSLLVLPASLLANWKAELKRFAPSLDLLFVHPAEADRSDLADLANGSHEALRKADLVLTTYGMLLRQTWLLDVGWRLVILDEAQAIKTPSARQTRAVKKLKSDARIALTGTPVENRLSDLWSLFDFLCPGLLGSAEKFKKFVKAMEARPHDRYAPLRNLVGPYILRRLKTDRSVISDLPDKTEMKVYCGLSKRQALLYRRSVDDLARGLEDRDGIRRRGLVLAYLMRFKQICNHPSQCEGDGRYDPEDSGKFERLGILCEEIASRQDKVLVFTQFRELTEPLAVFLEGVFGREGLILHGGTAVKTRSKLIEAFGREDGPPFFVLSLKAGGTGLNLTAASHVIHFDRWWNPAVENQATDRAFRIGQHRNVVVHKFVCRGTVEEKIDALIEGKSDLAGNLLAAGAESVLTEMNDEELMRTVALDIDRAEI